MTEDANGSGLSAGARQALRLEIEDFNTEYAAVLDRGDLRDWPRFFTEDAIYRVTGRENYDESLPLGTLYCDSRAMMEDRVFAILNTAVYAPRTLLHLVTNARVIGTSADGTTAAEANFLIVQNLLDRNPKLLMGGRYCDAFVRADGRLLLKERHCVYDTLTVQTSIVVPV